MIKNIILLSSFICFSYTLHASEKLSSQKSLKKKDQKVPAIAIGTSSSPKSSPKASPKTARLLHSSEGTPKTSIKNLQELQQEMKKAKDGQRRSGENSPQRK